MDKENYKLYAELEEQKKEIEEKQSRIKSEILEEMISQQSETVKADFGTFSLMRRKTWKYSPAVDELGARVKELKKTEEESGLATFEESTVLTFRSK